MTNKDLLHTLSKFGTKESSSKQDVPYELPIYGPQTTKAEPKPTPSKSKNGHREDGDIDTYPDIYGPEVTMTPGTKHTKKMHTKQPSSGKVESDTVDQEEDAYQFNPDFQKAFPVYGNPQPFLTDFSKFQH
jgi:hypothetical protein